MSGKFGSIWRWIRWPVALALLGWLFSQNQNELSDFARREKNWYVLSAAFALCGLGTCLTFLRWYLLVWGLDFPFRLRDAFRLGFLGLVFNYFGPGLVGGDMFKAVIVAREQASRRTVAAATVLLDRVLGMISLFQLGALATLAVEPFLAPRIHRAVCWGLWGGSLAGLVGVFVLVRPILTHPWWIARLGRIPVIGRLLVDVVAGFSLYQNKPRLLLVAILIGIVSHAAFVGALYSCALALGGWAPSLWMHLFFMPAAIVLGLLPTPGGIGPLEWAIQEAYGFAAMAASIDPGAARAEGLFAAMAFRLVQMVFVALGAAYYLTARKEIEAALEVDAATGGNATDETATKEAAES